MHPAGNSKHEESDAGDGPRCGGETHDGKISHLLNRDDSRAQGDRNIDPPRCAGKIAEQTFVMKMILREPQDRYTSSV